MKIALLTDGIHPYVIGGMQKHSFYLAKYFAKQKVFVDLYHTNKSTLDIEKLEFFTEDEKRYIKHFVIDFPTENKFPGHYINASFHYSERIYEILSQNLVGIDFIYAKGFTSWKLIKEKQKGFICPPVGINLHGYEMFQKAPNFKSFLQQKFLLEKPARFNIENADYLFSYGGKITSLIKKLTPDHSKIIEIPTGIEREWINTNKNIVHSPVKFVFVGRYERRKGIQELHSVLKKMAGNYPFEFNFIGPIPVNKQIKSGQVHYYGSIQHSEKIKEILSKNDVLVCPSHSEGMPNVIAEAMASGLSIISSDVGAVNQLVTADNGILVEPGNTSELETAIKRMIEIDPDKLSKMKQKSIHKIEECFLWDKIILETIEKIQKVIE